MKAQCERCKEIVALVFVVEGGGIRVTCPSCEGVYVVAAVPNVTAGYFTIYLNKAVTTSVGPIVWIVTEHP